MKSFIGLSSILIVMLSTGSLFGGEHKRHGGSGSEHSDDYESRIYGTILKLPAGSIGVWDVNGRAISVTDATRIKEKHGKAEVGAYVEIEGSLSGSTLVAKEIKVKRARQQQ